MNRFATLSRSKNVTPSPILSMNNNVIQSRSNNATL